MEKKETKNAFVWLLMLGDEYLAGVLVSAWSFRKKFTKCDLVIMVTPDIFSDTKNTLSNVFDLVIDVPYIEVTSTKMRTWKQNKIYYSWINKSYTKWNALSLVQYEKVCLIDADVVILKNIDELFELNAPSSIFKSSYEKIYDPYKNPKHGSVIKPSQIWQGLTKQSFVASAYIILLPTSMNYYEELIKMINLKDIYGFPTCYYGHDEQSISHYMSCYDKGPKLNWMVMDPRYGFNIGKYSMLNKDEVPYIIHYINKPKPWLIKNTWPDLDIWWSLCRDLTLVSWKDVKINTEKLKALNSSECYICKKFRGVDYNHPYLECAF